VFRNDVDDYIDPTVVHRLHFRSIPLRGSVPAIFGWQVRRQFYQYQNIRGMRASRAWKRETMYDARPYWFLGVSASFQEGKNVADRRRPADSIRAAEGHHDCGRAAVRQSGDCSPRCGRRSKANTDIFPLASLPANVLRPRQSCIWSVKPTANLTVVGVGGESAEPVLPALRRAWSRSGLNDTVQNDVLWASAGAGITFKGSDQVSLRGH
jgi:hemoglobin/transferrin/lactoferrin receptor protein